MGELDLAPAKTCQKSLKKNRGSGGEGRTSTIQATIHIIDPFPQRLSGHGLRGSVERRGQESPGQRDCLATAWYNASARQHALVNAP
eukprot:5902687-Pyramimonas_sp.AAC.1